MTSVNFIRTLLPDGSLPTESQAFVSQQVAQEAGQFVTDAQAARDEARAARDVTIAAMETAIGSKLAHAGVAWYQDGAAQADTYAALDPRGRDVGARILTNDSLGRLTVGVDVNPAAQSRMRRCVLHNNGDRVVYYLDADNAERIAGLWDGSVQRGWVRVHEGTHDPVSPTPGRAATGAPGLRQGVAPYDAAETYARGDRVLHDGCLWDSLADAQVGVEPAPGASSADLSGGAGQVMVEIPRFYCRADYDPSSRRHSWEVVFDTATWMPFPVLTDAPDLPVSLVVNGRNFPVHPAFRKAGVERRARYVAAFGTSASDTDNNSNGVLRSVRSGGVTNTTSVSLTNYTAKARNRNAGLTDPSGHADDVWQVCDNWLWHAVQMLFLTEFRSLHSQAMIGAGNISGAVYNKVAGRSAPLGNGSGAFDADGQLVALSATAGSDGVAWRGIEDPWGTAYRRTAGGVLINLAEAKEAYWSNTPRLFVDASTSSESYELVTAEIIDPEPEAWQYATALAPGMFLASKAGGSTSTYLADGQYYNTSNGAVRTFSWGAAAGLGSSAGLFALFGSHAAGLAHVLFGAALAR